MNASSKALGTAYTEVTPLTEVHQKLAEQGFAIVKEHQLPDEFCEKAKDEVWQALENLISSPSCWKIKRNDPTTYLNYFKLEPGYSMMLQHFGFSQMPMVWRAREAAAPIFAHLWNVKETELTTSMDAISFSIAPEHFDPCEGEFDPASDIWWHVDQAINKLKPTCIQGFYNLCECGPDVGCLSVLEGSLKYHADMKPMFYENVEDGYLSTDWHYMEKDELDYIVETKDCKWRFVCPPKGAFVIWDSRTVHMATKPRLPRADKRDRFWSSTYV